MTTRRAFLAGALAGAAGAAGRVLAGHAVAAHDFCVKLCDGRQLMARQFGPSTNWPVFYFHGMPGSRLEVGLIAEELVSGGACVLSLDRPGIGGSDFQPRRRMNDWPCDVAQVADRMGWGQFSVIGVSGGAPFALACAAQLCGRVPRVALISGHAPFHEPEVEKGNQDTLVVVVKSCPRLARVVLRMKRGRLARQPQAVVEGIAEKWNEDDRRLVLGRADYTAQFIANLRQAFCYPRGLALDIGLLARRWPVDFCAAGRCSQVAIWHGRCDPIAPPSHGRFFHSRIPNSRLTLGPTSHVTTGKYFIDEIAAHVVVDAP